MSPSTSTLGRIRPSTFESLGVRPMINCGGTYTYISGSRMIDVAAQAMLEATNHYVNIAELMERVGERLAEITQAEWGYVTTGAAAAISQITAACIAGADPEKITRLPDTAGMPNEIIEQAANRSGYEQSMRIAGGRIVIVDTDADLQAALSERTAMIAIDGDSEARLGIPVQRMIAMGREHGVPVFVDAAAQRVDVPNRYLQMGADAVAYSGGKCLRGPQASGLLLGRKDLLQAAFLNASPHGSQGRGMKAGKEEIMALLAAVEAFILGRDHEAEWRMWEGYLATMRAAVVDLPSVSTEDELPGVANVTPYLLIRWDPAVLQATPQQVHSELLDGEPRILINLTRDGLRINPYMMEDGDDAIVAKRLRTLLSNRQTPPARGPVEPPAIDVSGNWLAEIDFVCGRTTHSLHIVQDGAELSGTYRSQYGSAPLSGHLAGQLVVVEATLCHQTGRAHYRYSGMLQGEEFSGQVSVGQEWPAQFVAQRLPSSDSV